MASVLIPIAIAVALSSPRIISDLSSNKPPQQVMSDLVPALEAASDLVVPGLGTAEQFVFIILGPVHPMTPQEEKQWMVRFSIETQK